MREVEFWNWWLPSDRGGKPAKSRWKMSAETAAGYPGAVRVEGTREPRMLPESADEFQYTGHAQDGPPRSG
jgi:hypothetical protein